MSSCLSSRHAVYSHEFSKRTADFYHLWPLPWEMRAQPSQHFFHVKDMTPAVTPHCPLLPLSRAQHSGMWLMSPASAVWSAASFWRPWKSFSETFFPDPRPQLLSIWLATWYHPACCTYKMINFLPFCAHLRLLHLLHRRRRHPSADKEKTVEEEKQCNKSKCVAPVWSSNSWSPTTWGCCSLSLFMMQPL